MTTLEIEELARQAENLTSAEKLQLAALLIAQAHGGRPNSAAAPGWRELRARVAEPALGEEAQRWVSRTRQESGQRENR